MTPEQREGLARTLYTADKAPGSRHWGPEWDEHSETVKDIWRGYADRLAESDWMKARLSEARDAAWKEGYSCAAERGGGA
jgi:hypothetical protein